MRVVAIPAPLPTEPAAAVLVGIELPTALATKAGRIEFAVSAIDGDGAVRARTRFTTNFSAAEKTAAAWTRTGSRIDVPPGEYQIRVAAIGADKSEGSVFLDVAVPRFDAELGVGGLSLGASQFDRRHRSGSPPWRTAAHPSREQRACARRRSHRAAADTRRIKGSSQLHDDYRDALWPRR